MKKNTYTNFLFCLFIALAMSSCVSRSKMVYLANATQTDISNTAATYEPKIQVDDILQLVITAENSDVVAPYNLKRVQISSDQVGSSDQSSNLLMTYLVDSNGDIDMPQIGLVHIAGKTRREAIQEIKNKLSEYITEPLVSLRIANFKISVLGEVNRPDTYTVTGERITLLEAISKAGDLTIQGKRDNIIVIREVDGNRSINRVDLTNSDFITSPFYYLAQNDVVYVEPNQMKLNNANVGPSLTIAVSAVSLLISLIVIFTR
ncbi:MAG: polysaccharide biosynthesis/export family protein [Flavobacterium sp.]|nr:polysaccharide biosynthesis/export family protein [Candidatus Neoflavobacterium equi]